MTGPLMWLFDDAKNHSWVSKTPWKTGIESSSGEESVAADGKAPMTGNGFAWGQIAHVLAWIYAVLGVGGDDSDDIAIPTKVYCTMSHAPKTGADISLAAVITCHDGVTFSLAGTALLPGSQYSSKPVGKHIKVELFGENGSLMYGGDDKIPESGRLELRKTAVGKAEDGRLSFPCSNHDWTECLGDMASELKDGFYFEDGEQKGLGPGSMAAFLEACRASSSAFAHSKHLPTSAIDDSLIGLRTVQVIDAMYRSSSSGSVESICQ
mmetsp:Transcript_13092/g.22444  ORF Transcript_13092/g.22444 Transcript_13092/m.22444 type:complete len:266 (+) Transcript_13092:72-869(+)